MSSDAAAWTEASATVVAVGAAIFAGRYAKKAYDKEVQRDEQRENERRSAQAEKVAAWCERWVGEAGAWNYERYYLRNASDIPVYDVVVLFRQGKHSLGTDSLDVLPPADEPVVREVPVHVRNEAHAAEAEHGQIIRPLVSFRDAAGRHWRRTAEGLLVRSTLQGEPAPAMADEDRHEALGVTGDH